MTPLDMYSSEGATEKTEESMIVSLLLIVSCPGSREEETRVRRSSRNKKQCKRREFAYKVKRVAEVPAKQAEKGGIMYAIMSLCRSVGCTRHAPLIDSSSP